MELFATSDQLGSANAECSKIAGLHFYFSETFEVAALEFGRKVMLTGLIMCYRHKHGTRS